ncbi:MAG TPA: response regulator [Ramlibacter sp.]|uniref:response regulator transcription factor n=1 Tax=Ramlibacter sp. TaxID=1917967 RepID=UPI002ED501F7
MHPQDVYAPTPRGESQLRSTSTTLSAAELELLVRFDGLLTLQQVLDGLSEPARASFQGVFAHLQNTGLLQLVEADPLTLTWNADVRSLARAVGEEEVDAGLSSLQRSGFYVQIARQRQSRVPQPGRPLTAVVVEDEPTLAKFTTMLLTLSGFEVRHAADRAEVVAQIRRPPVPDVILLDVMLPDADGFDILERVRQHPVLKDVPVVMLTAKATRESVIRGISLGADGYITKPCSAEGLLQVVRTVLGLPQDADLKAWNQHAPR